ncbi:MAG: hypothetical protein QOJ87_1290 [Verrucomicrobiota bacterium]|jgi:hypothetical protein
MNGSTTFNPADLPDADESLPWASDITDSDLITEEKADFLLAEAKEQLCATVSDAEALTKTGVYLLGGLLTVTSALVGVTASMFRTTRSITDQPWLEVAPLLITTVYLAIDALMLMWSALSIKGLDHCGNAPKNIASTSLFALELRLIKFAEAASYQARIDKNHRRNELVGIRINRGIKIVCVAPLIYLALLTARLIWHP